MFIFALVIHSYIAIDDVLEHKYINFCWPQEKKKKEAYIYIARQAGGNRMPRAHTHHTCIGRAAEPLDRVPLTAGRQQHT